MDFTASDFGAAYATRRRERVVLGVDVGGGLEVDVQMFKGGAVYDNGPPVTFCQGPIALSAKPVEILQVPSRAGAPRTSTPAPHTPSVARRCWQIKKALLTVGHHSLTKKNNVNKHLSEVRNGSRAETFLPFSVILSSPCPAPSWRRRPARTLTAHL